MTCEKKCSEQSNQQKSNYQDTTYVVGRLNI